MGPFGRRLMRILSRVRVAIFNKPRPAIVRRCVIAFKTASKTRLKSGHRRISGRKVTRPRLLSSSRLKGPNPRGPARFLSSTSSSLTQAVNATTATALASFLNPSTRGQTVTFTATVTSSSGTPTGTVTLRDGGSSLGSVTLSFGQASLSTSRLSRGTHTITATYNGTTGYFSSTSAPLTQQVN